MCDFSRPYKIVQIPDTCCWTEGPSNLAMLYRQRTRWARGLFQTLSIHHKMIFKKTYKQMGMLTLPYMFIFEFYRLPLPGLHGSRQLEHGLDDLSDNLHVLPVLVHCRYHLRLLRRNAL